MAVHPALAALHSRGPIRAALVRVRRPDGAELWLQVDVAAPRVDDRGGLTVVASLTDVTRLLARTKLRERTTADRVLDTVADVLADTRLDPNAILASVTKSLSHVRAGIWVAAIMGKDPSAMRVVATDESDPTIASYIEAMRTSGAVSTTPLMTRVIESGEPLLLPSVSLDGLASLLDDEVRRYMGVHPSPWPFQLGVLIVPMRARGAIIGTIALFERAGSKPLDQQDVVWMQAVADRVGVAIENAQLYGDAVQRLDRLSALQEISLALSASPDLRLTLKVILDHVTARLGVDAADVLLLDDADNALTVAASTGFVATTQVDHRLPADDGIPGRAISSRRIETVTAMSAFAQFRRRSMFAREGFKAYGAVPLVSRGKLLGALEVFHRSALTPDQEWLAFLDALGSVAAVAIDSATMQDSLHLRRDGGIGRRSRSPEMTATEAQVFRLAVDGMTNVEIGARIHLSHNTVKFHMRKILQRTGAANRTELASLAVKEGWL